MRECTRASRDNTRRQVTEQGSVVTTRHQTTKQDCYELEQDINEVGKKMPHSIRMPLNMPGEHYVIRQR